MIIEWKNGIFKQPKHYYLGLGVCIANWNVVVAIIAIPFGATSEIIERGQYFSEIIERGQYFSEIIEKGGS
jgi:hypothetical protein